MGPNAQRVFIVNGKRTPFGKFGGSLKTLTPLDLAVLTSQDLLADTHLNPETIDQVIFANVLPVTPDTLYGARHIALKCGMKTSTPGVSVNRLCGSGIQAIIDATRIIHCQEAEAILISGAENMSMSPHLVYGSRFGTKYGSLVTKDLLLETLHDKHVDLPMGLTAEALAQEFSVTREEADQFACLSHQRASQAYTEGLIQPELTTIKISRDEHLRDDVSYEEMQKLKSTFKKEGTVTAASASGIVDGAASMLLCSEEFVNKHKLKPIAEVIDSTVIGVEPGKMGIGPVPAIEMLLNRQEMKISDIDLFEINEAFAPQVLACQKALQIPSDKLNIWGGAIALGHPLGATGIKISLTLARQLQHYKKQYGISAACIGGGQGIALLMKRL
jgi:acetyl-CoA acyltransferase 2